MDFKDKFNKTAVLDFLKNQFLPDDFEESREIIKFEQLSFTPDRIKEIEYIGESSKLDLKLYVIRHDSENDPRVTLSRETFRFMSNRGARRALIVFYSSNSANYRLSLATITLALKGAKVKKEYSNPRRYSFFLGSDAKTHTPEQFLVKKGPVTDFPDLKNRFSVEVVTEDFYREIANWYFWALKHVRFPQDAEEQTNGRNIALIRLITRLIFVWFMRQKKLVTEDLFDKEKISVWLKDLSDEKSTYYPAILQNLFWLFSLSSG